MKKIDYKIFKLYRGEVFFQIIEQTHIGTDFSTNSKFTSSEGFCLLSYDFPMVSICEQDKYIFVRGEIHCKDYQELKLPLWIFMKFAKAVKEYNEVNK